MTESLGKTTSTISQHARKLKKKGCIKFDDDDRGMKIVIFKYVDWDTLKCIVEIFEEYRKDYIKLMKTGFGDRVVDFLSSEIRKLKNYSDFDKFVLEVSKEGLFYLERNLEEFVEGLDQDTRDSANRRSMELWDILRFREKIHNNYLVSLFGNLLREAIKRQARYNLDEEIIKFGVKFNYHFLDYMVRCYDGTLSKKGVDKLAKFALAVLSIPPAFHVEMWENIRINLIGSYRLLLEEEISEKDSLSEKESDFQNLNNFELTFGGLGYIFYKLGHEGLTNLISYMIANRPELLNTLHAIGFLYLSPRDVTELKQKISSGNSHEPEHSSKDS